MKIFVDANVLVSVLNREYPLFTYAARVLSLTDAAGFEVYTSPVCLAIAFYFAEKKSGNEQAKRKIVLLAGKLRIAPADERTVRLAAGNSAIHDFEDGLEYYAAVLAGCETVITEDKDDFYFSEVPVYGCEEYLKQLRSPLR